MHELAVTESILEIVERHAPLAGAGRVTDLHLVLGEMATIVDESVQFYWDIVSRGTVAEGARLHFRRVPALFRCTDCHAEFGLTDALACPTCGSMAFVLVQGDEFRLEAIDVDDGAGEPDAAPAVRAAESGERGA